MKANRIIRNLFSNFQKPSKSAEIHGSSYSRELRGESNVEKIMHIDIDASFEDLGPGFKELILEFSSNSRVAVDIGAGTGWLSTYLGRYFDTVISVEPSIHGINLGKNLLLENATYSKNFYLNCFAEDFFSLARFVSPVLVFFQTVLSHLPDHQVKNILMLANTSLPIGSKILFSEVFGDDSAEVMWFVRNKEWWISNLPNWDLDFFGNKLTERPEFKGFAATRVA